MLVARAAAAAGRAADLHGLELLAVGDAAADVEDDLADGRTHGHLDQARVHDVARQGEGLRAGALGRSDAAVPVGPAAQDERGVGEGLDVVEDGRLRPQAVLDGARRLDARHAALALDGRGQGAALAADERARTAVDVDAEGEVAAEDVVAQQAQLLGFFDGGLETRHGQRILGADIDIALVTPGGASGDHHALEHGVGLPSMMERSMNAPGSPSSPLQTMYFFAAFWRRAPAHLRPAGKPPPPRPRRPEVMIS